MDDWKYSWIFLVLKKKGQFTTTNVHLCAISYRVFSLSNATSTLQLGIFGIRPEFYASTTNILLGWKCLQVTNTPAYNARTSSLFNMSVMKSERKWCQSRNKTFHGIYRLNQIFKSKNICLEFVNLYLEGHLAPFSHCSILIETPWLEKQGRKIIWAWLPWIRHIKTFDQLRDYQNNFQYKICNVL
jgi:hypothetical protein